MPDENVGVDKLEEGQDGVDQDLTIFDASDTKKIKVPSGVDMGRAEAFDVDELNTFLLERSARTIAIVGEFHSGKTTLPTALYGYLKEGSFGTLEFAESRTLIGFERRLFTLTVESGRTIPETSRTSKQSDLQFLHLDLIDTVSGKRRDLFFSDRAGEYFTQLRSGEILHDELKEFEKADVLVFLLDGEKISNSRTSSNVYENVRQTIRTLIEGNAIRSGTVVQLVTTKWDYIERADNKERVIDRLEQYEVELKAQFAADLPDMSFKHVAAQSVETSSHEHISFQALVSGWVSDEIEPRRAVEVIVNIESEFERILERVGEIE